MNGFEMADWTRGLEGWQRNALAKWRSEKSYSRRVSHHSFHIDDYENGWPDNVTRDPDLGWLAAHWGLNPFSPDLRRNVNDEAARRKPCRCGAAHRDSVDPRLCDSCFMREAVRRIREREAVARRRELLNERRLEAARLISRMPAGRRSLIERSGMDFSSPEQAYAEAFNE